MAVAALAKGGHLRVLMEDVLTIAKGQPVRHNAELVERAATLTTISQRPPLTPDQAHALLQTRPQ